MEFNPQKVNEGRLVTALSLEDRVLSNGVLPNCTLVERASLVRGIIQGLLEQGNWQEAVKMVYQDGSIVRGLFDGDWEEFRQDVLKSARQRQDDFFYESTLTALMQHKETELVYQLAMELPLREDNAEEIITSLRKTITPEQQKMAHTHLGNRWMAKKAYHKAYDQFSRAENPEKIDQLYTMLLEDPSIDTIEVLLLSAQNGTGSKPEKVTAALHKIVPFFIADQQKSRQRKEEYFSMFYPTSKSAQLVYRLRKEFEISLTSQEEAIFDTAAVRALPSYQAQQMEDITFSLLWAQRRYAECPRTAYHIFRRLEYTGKERIRAVKAGLEKKSVTGEHIEKLSPGEVEVALLHAVYKDVRLETQVAIAAHLKDDEKLQFLSRTYETKNEHHRAYHLWMQGHGDLENAYITAIRQHMIDELVQKEYFNSYNLFDLQDRPGALQLYPVVLERKPDLAYHLAKGLEDESLLQKAREVCMAQTPIAALIFFKEEKDSKGIEMAVAALADRFSLPVSLVKDYI
ncbi:hypothetical protein HYU22_04035 [Candidatus Woesearchaeota archaeon]|nr:hypothetical protein [Candidatus Woesearchaeota archaeon]